MLTQKRERLNFDSEDVEIKISGTVYKLFNPNSDRNKLEISDLNVLHAYNDLIEGDLKSGYTPYMILSPEEAEIVLEKGLIPEKSVGRIITTGNNIVEGLKEVKIRPYSETITFFLNRIFPQMNKNDYILILKNTRGLGLAHPFMREGKNGPVLYRGVVKTLKNVPTDDFVMIQASKSEIPGIEKFFKDEDIASVEIVPFLRDGEIDEVLNSSGSSKLETTEPSTDEINDVLFEIKEDTEEDIEGQRIYWEDVLDGDIYSEHDFERRNFNSIRDMKVKLYEISEMPLDERIKPYNHWEADDFVTLEEMLEVKIHEVKFFMKICSEMKKSFDWMQSMSESKKKWEIEAVENEDEEDFDLASELYDNENDSGILLKMFSKLLERRVKREKFSKETVLKMQKGLENFFRVISK